MLKIVLNFGIFKHSLNVINTAHIDHQITTWPDDLGFTNSTLLVPDLLTSFHLQMFAKVQKQLIECHSQLTQASIASSWSCPPAAVFLRCSRVTQCRCFCSPDVIHKTLPIVPSSVCVVSAAPDLHRRKYFFGELMGIVCARQVPAMLACLSHQKIRRSLFDLQRV